MQASPLDPAAVVPLKAVVTRGVADLNIILGMTSAGPLEVGRDGKVVTQLTPDRTWEAARHNPEGALKLFGGHFGLRLRPASHHGVDSIGAVPSSLSFQMLGDAVGKEGAALLLCLGSRATWEAFVRHRVEPFLDAMGLSIAHVTWLHPERGEAWLVPAPRFAWPPGEAAVARLFERLVRQHGGPRVRAELKSVVPPGARTGDFLEQWTLSCAPCPPEASAQSADLEEVVRTLDRAQRDAPRGFVGMKLFRERFLPPDWAPHRRELALDAAIEAELVALHSVTDPKTDAIIRAIELNRANPEVAAALAR